MANLLSTFLQHFRQKSKTLLLFLLMLALLTTAILFRIRQVYPIEPLFLQPAKDRTIAIVMPHHDLLLSQFQKFYEFIPREERQNITRVYVLSPNHFQPEVSVIKTNQTTESAFPFTKSGVVVDTNVFANEHGVFLHVPYIAKNFPNAVVIPFLFTRRVSQQSLDAFTESLKSALKDEHALVLVSTDFSHYLPYAEAQEKDRETQQLVEAADAESILKLTDDNLDCPGCLYVLLRSLENSSPSAEVLFHGNSAQFMNMSANTPTTSYFVMKWVLRGSQKMK